MILPTFINIFCEEELSQVLQLFIYIDICMDSWIHSRAWGESKAAGAQNLRRYLLSALCKHLLKNNMSRAFFSCLCFCSHPFPSSSFTVISTQPYRSLFQSQVLQTQSGVSTQWSYCGLSRSFHWTNGPLGSHLGHEAVSVSSYFLRPISCKGCGLR